MPETPWSRATPRGMRAAFQRRLMIATGFVIVVLIAAIGLVGALTVQTLTARSTDTASASVSPAPVLPDVDLARHPGRAPLITAV